MDLLLMYARICDIRFITQVQLVVQEKEMCMILYACSLSQFLNTLDSLSRNSEAGVSWSCCFIKERFYDDIMMIRKCSRGSLEKIGGMQQYINHSS